MTHFGKLDLDSSLEFNTEKRRWEFVVRVATMRRKEVGVPSGVSLKVFLPDVLLPRNWHRISRKQGRMPEKGSQTHTFSVS